MPLYTALLDACVLVPITLADTLLRLAERELYRPLWSARILAEAADAVPEVHPDLTRDVVAKRFAVMNDTFEDACVEGWEALGATLTLPDADDRHVVAAAMRGRADTIVTANVRDFPDDVLASLDIAVVDPDDFLLDQLDLAPRVVLDVLREQAAHMRNPPLTPTDLLARLAMRNRTRPSAPCRSASGSVSASRRSTMRSATTSAKGMPEAYGRSAKWRFDFLDSLAHHR